MGSMEEFVHYANLIFVKRQLADPSITDEQRRMLASLLALEEAKRFHERTTVTLNASPTWSKRDMTACEVPLI